MLTQYMQQQNEAMQKQQSEMQKNFSMVVQDMQSLSEFRAERLQFQQMMERMVIEQKDSPTDPCPEPRTSTPIVPRSEPPVRFSKNPTALLEVPVPTAAPPPSLPPPLVPEIRHSFLVLQLVTASVQTMADLNTPTDAQLLIWARQQLATSQGGQQGAQDNATSAPAQFPKGWHWQGQRI